MLAWPQDRRLAENRLHTAAFPVRFRIASAGRVMQSHLLGCGVGFGLWRRRSRSPHPNAASLGRRRRVPRYTVKARRTWLVGDVKDGP